MPTLLSCNTENLCITIELYYVGKLKEAHINFKNLDNDIEE